MRCVLLILRLIAVCVTLGILPALLLAAEPLAVLECREITGRDWGRTLVTYHLEAP
jgi:hypothetical protein